MYANLTGVFQHGTVVKNLNSSLKIRFISIDPNYCTLYDKMILFFTVWYLSFRTSGAIGMYLKAEMERRSSLWLLCNSMADFLYLEFDRKSQSLSVRLKTWEFYMNHHISLIRFVFTSVVDFIFEIISRFNSTLFDCEIFLLRKAEICLIKSTKRIFQALSVMLEIRPRVYRITV
jgi:hypothetical protein